MAIYIGLGSNIGNREGNLRMALRYLEPLARAVRVSSIYETAPVGVENQPNFYNCAAEIVAGLQPAALMRHLQNIEYEIGRRPGPRWGPRPIDLDLLLYDTFTLDSELLTLPHPRLQERAFVLVPLAEIAPDARHPALPGSIAELAASIDKAGVRPLEAASPGWPGGRSDWPPYHG
jgi:2-amino-4-hydroxy-6-hydroxymethyldihydropteridine diphosphokinase